MTTPVSWTIDGKTTGIMLVAVGHEVKMIDEVIKRLGTDGAIQLGSEFEFSCAALGWKATGKVNKIGCKEEVALSS